MEEQKNDESIEVSETLLHDEEQAINVTSDLRESETTPENQSNGITIKKSHLIIGVAVALVLVIGGFFLGYFVKRDDAPKSPGEEITVLPVDPMKPDPNAKPYDEVTPLPEEQLPESIILPGYTKLLLGADSDVMQSDWRNTEKNACYLRYTLRLSETGETVYQSGLIAPGTRVEYSKLTRTFSRGVYSVELLIESFSLSEDPLPLNSLKEQSIVLYVN